MRHTLWMLTAGLVLAATIAPVAVPRPAAGELDLAGNAPRGGIPTLFAADLEEATTLGVGRMARDVGEHLPAVEAMSSYLEARIAGLGFKKARPVIARDNAEMIDFLRRGIVDIVSETPVSAVHYAEAAGATFLLKERRRGHASYGSVVFVRSDSPVQSLADLRGRRVAFEDPGSTTAFLLPLAAIKRAALPTARLEDATSPPVADQIGYFFTLSESSIATAVMRRAADAGALSDEEFAKMLRRQPERAADLRVISRSDPVPRAFLLAGPAMTAEQRDALRALLLTMEADSGGRDVLQRYAKVDGFDTIDASLERQIDDLEAIYALVREEMRHGEMP